MQLPNKLYSYENSTLALMPKVLKRLSQAPVSVKELYISMRGELQDPTDFLSVMDCLYALRAIDMDEDGEVFAC